MLVHTLFVHAHSEIVVRRSLWNMVYRQLVLSLLTHKCDIHYDASTVAGTFTLLARHVLLQALAHLVWIWMV